MLKILKIFADDYKMLSKNFEISFETLSRVYEKDLSSEILEIRKSLYTHRSIAFVGANSSGKTTLLSLIYKSALLLQTGRWSYDPREENENIKIKIEFFLNDNIYTYFVTLGKPILDAENTNQLFRTINDEKLLLKKANGFMDLTNSLLDKSLKDTSSIINVTKNQIMVNEFNTNNVIDFKFSLINSSFFSILENSDEKLTNEVIKLLDESIEYIKCTKDNLVRFKRIKDEKEKIMTRSELVGVISSGTLRGVELYLRAISAIKYGKMLIVDEIENCFQKNLVFNLLMLFNDSKINSSGAQLIFSTHYVEILDSLNRRDGIFITHKNENGIEAKNLYTYNLRTEISKSNQFDNNAFNTSLNYEQLMIVKRMIISELHTHND
jgi:ABC-type molybdenum transport system ATPase subunit/photorepair protein PhrA